MRDGQTVPRSPALSVVVPVHQGGDHLRVVLSALRDSDLPRVGWELIVVDDASTDGSAEIAAASADLVVRLHDRPRGPAYARNRGFEASRAAFVAFIDADVLVRADALARMLEAIGHDASVGAVVGTYDAGRASGRILSQYRNLLRHFEHRRNVGETDTFTAGLAIVRREAFVRAGMFDEWRFPRPLVEALELGDRLRAHGYRILRPANAEATHLKQWTLRHWIRVDLLDRGISIGRLNQCPEFRERADRLFLATPLDGLLAWGAVSMIAMGAWRASPNWTVAGVGALLLLAARHGRLIAAFFRARGIVFAAAALPIHIMTCATYRLASVVGRVLYYAVGEPQPDPVTQAFAEVGVRTWPPVPAPSPTIAGVATGARADTAAHS